MCLNLCAGKCIYGEVRLVGGGVSYEGKLEYCSDDRIWVTLVNNGWTELETAVVCSQLGIPPGGELTFLRIHLLSV